MGSDAALNGTDLKLCKDANSISLGHQGSISCNIEGGCLTRNHAAACGVAWGCLEALSFAFKVHAQCHFLHMQTYDMISTVTSQGGPILLVKS